LRTKSLAPLLSALIVASSPREPVTKMNGISAAFFFATARAENPSNAGNP